MPGEEFRWRLHSADAFGDVTGGFPSIDDGELSLCVAACQAPSIDDGSAESAHVVAGLLAAAREAGVPVRLPSSGRARAKTPRAASRVTSRVAG